MDPRVKILKAAFDHQSGEGFDFPVYQGRIHYGHGFNFPVFQGHSQSGGGFGDVMRGIIRFFRPVAFKGIKTALQAGAQAMKDGANSKDMLKSTLKPTLGAVLGATAEQVPDKLMTEKPTTAPPPGPSTEQLGGVLVGTQGAQKGSGKRKASIYLYKSEKKSKTKYPISRPQRLIIYNF